MADVSKIKLPDGSTYNFKDDVSGYITSSDMPITIIEGTIDSSSYYTTLTLTNTTYSDIYDIASSGKTIIVRTSQQETTGFNSYGDIRIVYVSHYDSNNYLVIAEGSVNGSDNGINLITYSGSSSLGTNTVVLTASRYSIQEKLTFDGTYNASTNKAATVSTVTNAINALDGGTIGTGGTTKTITSLSQSNGNVSATFSNIAFPVTSVNSQTGAVSLSIPSTASDVGAIAAPSSASSGQFLKYNGTSWVADNAPGGATITIRRWEDENS